MPRVGLNIVEEAPNDITDRCSHRSDPGNIDTQAGALSSLYHSAPQGCLLYVWKAIFTLVLANHSVYAAIIFSDCILSHLTKCNGSHTDIVDTSLYSFPAIVSPSRRRSISRYYFAFSEKVK